jgi:hypothetical protein
VASSRRHRQDITAAEALRPACTPQRSGAHDRPDSASRSKRDGNRHRYVAFRHADRQARRGHDRITDFTQGQDQIDIYHVTETDFSSSLDFGDLDSNGDGTLGAGDALVDIERSTDRGERAWSTTIDPGAVMDSIRGDDFFSRTPSVLRVFGATGLRVEDFAIDDRI